MEPAEPSAKAKAARTGTAMAEEVRFFLRVALFTVVIGTIYWFVSYEIAGTALLAGIVASALFFIVLIAGGVRAVRRGPKNLKGILGFEETGRDDPLALGEDVFPAASAWPVVASISAVLVTVGLVYGAWLWIPGTALGLACIWGWLTELE